MLLITRIYIRFWKRRHRVMRIIVMEKTVSALVIAHKVNSVHQAAVSG